MRGFAALPLTSLATEIMAAPQVMIQTRLEPESGLRAGQAIRYQVDVLTDTWLTATPEFSQLQVPGTLVDFEGSRGRSIQRTINGKRYFGVTYSYRLVALEAGVITLPELQVLAAVGQADIPVAATVPERSFAVQALPGLEADTLLAGDVQLTQQLVPAGNRYDAGQPLTRQIRVVAERALPLAIPALMPAEPGAAAGNTLTATPLPAEVRHLTDGRGRSTGGERLEQLRYLPESGGQHTLPALSLSWWDIDENRLKQSELPALEIEVIPPPQRDKALASELFSLSKRLGAWSERQPTGLWFGLITLCAAAGWGVRRYSRPARRWLVRWGQQRYHQSTFIARFRAQRQLKRSSPVLDGTYQLVRRLDDQATVRESSLDPYSEQALLDSLDHYYRRNPDPHSGRRMLSKTLRKKLMPRHNRHRRTRASLPPLNPEP